MSQGERTPHCDENVGARVEQARKAAGLSQLRLAFPGASDSYLSYIERGYRIPSLQVLSVIAQKTGVSLNFLAWGEERINEHVAAAMLEVEQAEEGSDLDVTIKAYKRLSRAAAEAAKALAARRGSTSDGQE